MRRYLPPALLVVALVGASLAWRFTVLGDWVDVESLVARAEAMRSDPSALVTAPLVFVALSVLLVPITLLRVSAVIAFGPLWGPLLAMVGSSVAALIGFEIGRHGGGPLFERFAGPRVQRIRERVHGGGALAVAGLRLIPLGPFMIVNAACGAAGLHRRAFLIGTIIVMVPTLVAMALAVSLVPALADWFLRG